MSRTCSQRLLPLAFIVVTSTAHSDPLPATAVNRSDPTDAAAVVAPLHHRSAFETYRAAQPASAAGWVEANRDVAAIGGWRAYAREAQAPASAASGTDAGAAMPPTAAPHSHGHGSQTP